MAILEHAKRCLHAITPAVAIKIANALEKRISNNLKVFFILLRRKMVNVTRFTCCCNRGWKFIVWNIAFVLFSSCGLLVYFIDTFRVKKACRKTLTG